QQLGAGRCEPDEGAALVHHEPAALQRQLHACAVLRRAALVLEQERAVDQLDIWMRPSSKASTVLAISTMRRAAFSASACGRGSANFMVEMSPSGLARPPASGPALA